MNRRAFLSALSGSLLAAPLAAEAQPAGRPARVGFLTPSSRSTLESGERRVNREAFTRAVAWAWLDGEGKNLVVESRYAEWSL